MKTLFSMGFLAAMVLLATADATAQRNGDARSSGRSGSGRSGVSSSNGVINYQDNSSRNTLKTERDDRKKKAEEEAKKKAEEDRRRKEREEREKRWNEMRNGNNNNNNRNTQSQNRGTSGSQTAKGGNGRASKPDNKGGSTDPTTREVTEVMLDAVKTRTVQFDPAEAATQPGMLMLNSPRYDGSQRIRAGEKPIVEPL